MTTPEPLPEIRLSPTNRDVYHFLCKQEEYFDLDAPYQRGSVWSDEQRRNLIKSLLMKLPVGAVVVSRLPFDADRPATSYRVVDGKQRIEAVRAFSRCELTVPGHWFRPAMVTDPDARSRAVTVDDLSRYGRRTFESSQMPCIEFDGEHEWHDNPDFDPAVYEAERKVNHPGRERDPRSQRWITVPRSPEQIIAAEAELYLLVNFGGVAQTDEDMARAQGIADR